MVLLLQISLVESANAQVLPLLSGADASADETVDDIRDDDGVPRLSVSDASASEADGALSFTVTLGGQIRGPATVDYATADGTAVAGRDYTATTGKLTLDAGAARRTITVALSDDTVHEAVETFSVVLSRPVGAILDDAIGTGSIRDDDESPLMTIRGSESAEPGLLDFVVKLSTTSEATISVTYATDQFEPEDPPAYVQAQAGADFVHQQGVLTFAPGETAKTLRVEVLDDRIDESVEAVVMTLQQPVNVRFQRRAGSDMCPWSGCSAIACCDCGTIMDDDRTGLSIADATGSEDAVRLSFEVTLGGQVEGPVTVAYATSDGTAVAGEDYQATDGSLTFQAGTARQTIDVEMVDGDGIEMTETFVVDLSGATGAPLLDAQGIGTITDDDGPSLSVSDAEGGEADILEFVVTLEEPVELAATVDYATSDGTAVAGEDYEPGSGTLTFAPGESARTVSVSPLDDDVDESAETFHVTLSSPENATLGRATATGTVFDDDRSPTLSITGATGGEGGTLAFVVMLAGTTSARTVTVAYRTRDGSAVAGEDYEATSGRLTFAPGETRATVSVTVLDDRIDEPEEHLRLQLSAPRNAILVVREATGTIIDNDAGAQGQVLVFEPVSNHDRQGFVRVINHSDKAGEVFVEAIDDAGMRRGPVPLEIGANEVRHFNSDDLEGGNAVKGLPEGVGPPGEGIWRLVLASELDIEVLSYARTSDGFVTSLHDTAPVTAGLHQAVFLNPGGNVHQVSRLRLVNWGEEDARVTITGTDDKGGRSSEVQVDVWAGTAREWTAAELESGTGTNGTLGDGEGKWRLAISSDRPVVALSLIESPTGNLTNLSTLPRTPGVAAGSLAVPLFPSASDAAGRQGFVRVANLSSSSAEVRVEAFDATDREYEVVTVAVDVDQVASFNSDDLEQGNTDKGLTGSTGAGDGDWWLELLSDGDAEIDVGSYIRTMDGFLTAMHDLVPEVKKGEYRVAFFNPAENVNQVSVLWLVNRGEADARVTIVGVDDDATSPGSEVRTTVPAGSSRRLSSTELETGQSGAIESGALGDGVGKWRLKVVSDEPLMVMSLLENPTGHLTNLSTATRRDETRRDH